MEMIELAIKTIENMWMAWIWKEVVINLLAWIFGSCFMALFVGAFRYAIDRDE